MQSQLPNQKSIPELLQSIVDDVTKIARLEVQSVRAQIVAELQMHRQLSVLLIAGGGLGCLALGAITLGSIDYLAEQTQWPRSSCSFTIALCLAAVSGAILAGRKKWEQILKLSKQN